MIHDIQNPTQALDILRAAATWYPHEPCHFITIFNLDESLDPMICPTCLSQCETCDLTVDFKTDQQPVTKCPRCREDTLKVIAIAELVIQGSVVLWRES